MRRECPSAPGQGLVAWALWYGPGLCLALVLGRAEASAGAVAAAGPVDFGRDVLPILSDRCFPCHGPDAKARKAGLRLDLKEGALRGRDPVIVPGLSADSELILRVTSGDPDEVMPPPKSGKALEPRQVELLRRWVDEGATWGRHWALEPPRRPAPPPVRDRSWPRNPVDHYVMKPRPLAV